MVLWQNTKKRHACPVNKFDLSLCFNNWHPGRNWQQWHAGRFEHARSRIDLTRLDHGTLTLFPYLTLHFLWSTQNFFCIHKILALRSADSLAIKHDLREIIILFLSLILNDKKNSNGENTESKQPFCAQTLHFVYDAFSCIWWPLQNLSQRLRLNTLNSLSCMIFCGNGSELW